LAAAGTNQKQLVAESKHEKGEGEKKKFLSFSLSPICL
jgi:hypothetical protein